MCTIKNILILVNFIGLSRLSGNYFCSVYYNTVINRCLLARNKHIKTNFCCIETKTK